MSQLRVTSAQLGGKVFELEAEYFTIGREPDNSIVLDHTSVSKHHAILKIDGGDFKLYDMHSTNGVIVNGVQQVVAHLRAGDKIVLGEVELRFEVAPKDATQRMTLPLVPKSDPPKPPTVPEPPPEPPEPTRHKRSPLFRFLRKDAVEPPASDEPPPREKIHAGLTETFGKMGLDLPKPPVAPKPPPKETKPVTLPPPPKPISPKPPPSKALRLDAPPVAQQSLSESNVALAEPPVAVVEPTLHAPAVEPVTAPTPPRLSRAKTTYAGMCVAGVVVLGLGYLVEIGMFKFIGLVSFAVGVLALVFTMRFGALIAPPKKRTVD